MFQERTLFKQVSGIIKKLVSVSATSTSMTSARKEALERVLCIHYLVQLKDTDKTPVQALIDSGSKVNAIHPFFVKQLCLPIKPTDVGAQKIDGTTLDTHGMIVAAFSVVDKTNRIRFFEKTFLVFNISPEIVLGMSFLTLSSADVDFSGKDLRWRTYTTKEVFPTTKHVKLVGKKEFTAAALNPEYETYIVHIAFLSYTPLASLGFTLVIT